MNHDMRENGYLQIPMGIKEEIKKENHESKRKFDELALGNQEKVIEKLISEIKANWTSIDKLNSKLIANDFNLEETELVSIALKLLELAYNYDKGAILSSSWSAEVEAFAITKLKEAEIIKNTYR